MKKIKIKKNVYRLAPDLFTTAETLESKGTRLIFPSKILSKIATHSVRLSYTAIFLP